MTETKPFPRSSDVASWILIAGLVAAICVVQLRSPLAIDPAGLAGLALASCALVAASVFYRRVRVDEKLSICSIAMLQALLFSAAGCILSYLLAREGGALWDSTLSSWDRALGLDWLAYVRFVDSHAWIALPFRLAYGSLIPQVVAVILILGFRGRFVQLRTFILAAIISGSVAVLLSPLFPAVSSYVYLGLTQADFRHVNPWAGYVHLQDLLALRSGEMAVLNLPQMEGIITFPSYHAALAAVTMWAFWNSTTMWWRWPGVVVALMTIAATPVDGGHYFVDVIAGGAVALASLWLATRLIYARMPRVRLDRWLFRRKGERPDDLAPSRQPSLL